MEQWQRNGWRTASKQAVKNQDLWQRLAEEAARHNVSFKRVRGHTGVELNERADLLAVAERDRYATV
jgi:ribonuclease HI